MALAWAPDPLSPGHIGRAPSYARRVGRLSLLLVLCLTAPDVSASDELEPWLGSAVATAEVNPGAPLLVSVDYFLHPEGAGSVPFTALGLGGSRAANVRAFHGETELSFRTESADREQSARRLEGHVDLPAELREHDRVKLRLRYEVLPQPQAAISHETPLVFPMLVPGWPPEETGPTTFVATIRLPANLRVLDSFPSEYDVLDSPDSARATEAYRFSLPVMPALVRLRAGDENAPRLSAARALDLGAAIVLAALTVYGWRRVREHLR